MSSFKNFFVTFYREIAEKTAVFLYKFNHIYNIRKEKFTNFVRYNWQVYEGLEKLKWLLKTSFDITITGTVIWFIVHYLDNPLGYGLLTYITTHYIRWFIETIKGKK